jgi:hypothetical protein
MSALVESEPIDGVEEPFVRRVEIKDEESGAWNRGSFTDLQLGQVFRVYNDPTIDPSQEWLVQSAVYQTQDGVNAIQAAPSNRG